MRPKEVRRGFLACASALLLLSLPGPLGGCDADSVAAAVACGAVCSSAEACGFTDCRSRCASLEGDETLLLTCTGCLATSSDCTIQTACMGVCDPMALDAPECAAFCSDAVGACPNLMSCVSTCAAWDATKMSTCVACFELNRTACDVQAKCPNCF